MGTTSSERPGNFTVLGGLISFTKSVSSTSWPSGPLDVCQLTTVASAPFVMQHSVASLCFNMTGIPTHKVSLAATCLSEDARGCSHKIFCRPGDNTFVFLTESISGFFGQSFTIPLLSSGFLHQSIE